MNPPDCDGKPLPLSANAPAWRVAYMKDIEVYKPYPQLYDERVRSVCMRPMTSRISFMSLPGEIRNKIYKLAIPLDQVIELCPDYNTCQWGIKQQEKYDSHRKIISKQLKLLRVSKHINKETTPLYYRSNEFRFSGEGGWQVLAAFFLAIGPTNASHLSKIAVHIPFSFTSNEATCNDRDEIQSFFSKFGLKTPPQHPALEPYYTIASSMTMMFPWTLDAAFRFVIDTLKKNAKLKVLHLVVSATFSLRQRLSMYRNMPQERQITSYLPELIALEVCVPDLKIVSVEKYICRIYGDALENMTSIDTETADILDQHGGSFPRVKADIIYGEDWKIRE